LTQTEVVIVVQEYVVLGLFVLLVIELIVGEIINRMDTGISCNVARARSPRPR
jgi:hypothetical protein